MSKTIEERVVSMQFNNTQFEKGIEQSQKSIQNLNKNLDSAGTSNGLSSISIALESVSSGFSAFGAIGFTILQNLTNAAIDTGKRIGSALLTPIIEGGKKRALNIEQATFQFKALGMDVEKTMADASYAVDGTAYSLDAAAKVAAQLGASGMKAGEDMRKSLRGVSGVAAFAGSSYEDIGNIFTKVAGQGRLMGDDLLRLSSRGINAAAVIGTQIGKTEKQVREMVTKGKIDFKTFATAMDGAFGEHATKANETFTGSLANIKSALGRIGANVATPLFAQLIPVFNAFREVVNATNTALTPFTDALGELFEVLSKKIVTVLKNVNFDGFTTGMENGIAGLKAAAPTILSIFTNIRTIFSSFNKSIGVITGAISKAFSEIFPVNLNAGGLIVVIEKFTQKIAEVVKELAISEEASEKLKTIFKALFAVFEIGAGVVLTLAGALSGLLSFITPISWFLLDVTAAFAEFILKTIDAIKRSEVLDIVLRELSRAFDSVKEGLKKVSDAFDIFVEWFKNTSFLQAFVNGFRTAFDVLVKIFTGLTPVLEVLISVVGTAFSKIGEALSFIFGALSTKEAGDIINSGIIAVILVGFADFLDSLQHITDNAGGIINSFKGIFDGVRTSIVEYQKSIKANTLLKIAAAMGILAGAILLISTIDAVALTGSLTAITVLFAELFGSMAIFNASSKGDFVGITKVTTAMTILSVALLILASALKKLSQIDPEDMGGALLALTVALGEFIVTAKLMSGLKGFSGAATGLLIMSAALIVMAEAIKSFGNMDMDVMTQGLIGVAAGISLMVLAANGIPKNISGSSVGILILSAALLVMANAVKSFGQIPWEEMGRGLTGIAGALGVMALAMHAVPNDTAIKAAGLVILAGALLLIGKSIKSLGQMDWEELLQGLVGIAGALGVIALGMMAMTGALPGAAAMLIVAAALAVLTPVLFAFGQMSWEEMGKSLLYLAGIFVVFGVAGVALGALTPVLIGLAAAVALLGVGVLAIGAGLAAFAIGLTTLAAAGSAATTALRNVILTIIELVPDILKAIAEGFIEVIKVIGDNTPAIMDAFGKILAGLIVIITENIPAIVGALLSMLDQLLLQLVEYVPRFVDSGMKILQGFLKGIADNIQEVVATALLLVTNFIKGLTDGIPDLIDAGAKLLIAVLNGMAEAIDANAEEMGKAGGRLALAIVRGMVKGIKGAVGEVVGAVKEMANSAIKSAKKALGIASPSKVFFEIGLNTLQGLANGVKQNGYLAVDAVQNIANQMINAITSAFGFEVPTTLLDTLTDINKQMIASMQDVVNEAKETTAATKEALAEAEQALKDFKANAAGTNKTTSSTAKEAQAALDAWKEEQKIAAERAKLQKAVDNAKTDKAKNTAQKKLDAFDAAQEKKKLAAEKKALEAELKLAKAQEAAQKKELEAQLKAAKAAATAAAKEQAAREAAAKKLEEFTKNTIVPLETELSNLSEQYETLTAEIEAQTAVVDAAQKELDDYKASVKNAFKEASKLSGIGAARTTQQYLDSLQDTLDQALEYEENILKLVDLGLSQEAIDNIMAQGVESASATVKYLLDGADEETIAAINKSMAAIEEVGERLSVTLGNEYYQAGVDAAQGLLDGLTSKEKELIKAIDSIGNKLAEAMKKALEIKSPSRVMFRIGEFVTQGLIDGLLSLSEAVGKSGNEVADKLRKAMEDVIDKVDGDVDLNPVIQPVIDLSDVRKGFAELNNIMDTQMDKASNLVYRFEGTGTDGRYDDARTINNNTEVVQNFNDRVATPVEVYNATKFGLTGRTW